MQMKIAIFHTTLPEPNRKVGGVEVVVHRLANELAKDRNNKVVVFSLTPKPRDAMYEHFHVFAKAKWLRNNKFARLFILPFLLNFVSFKGYDVLHIHGDDWFWLRRNVPTVRTFQGSALREAQYASSLKRKLSQYLVYIFEHLSVKLATLPVATLEETCRIYGINEIIDNGVDLDLFKPGDKAPKPMILFVGTWEGRKRGKFLFDVFVSEVLPVLPEARLYMVSDYVPTHRNVVFVRFPDDEMLARLYREAWVFAMPSTYEGFGLPYLEALASGTAVISSPNPGALYVLENGKYGVLADDEHFGKRLIELLTNETLRKELEVKGLERAKGFSWSEVAHRYLQIYRKAIEIWNIKRQ